VTNCLALFPVALLPTLVGMAGTIYFVVALLLSAGLLWTAIALRRSGTLADARRLMMASLLYLPLLLAVMALDKLPMP
jgi:protoheme IX farnesyltransferase